MKPLVKIFNTTKYEMVITDVTQDSDEYVPESIADAEVYYQKNKFKYSETNTINIIEKITTSEDSIVKTIITDHSSKLDEAYYKLESDGYYVIHHFILPTTDWLDSELEKGSSILDGEMGIYVSDCENIYYYTKGQLITKEPSDLIAVNEESTTISKIIINRFSVGYLYDCYVSLCKQIFSAVNYKCLNKGNLSDTYFKRDFLWMTINVIKYYVEINQLLEAQRLLEEINNCGGLCNGGNVQTQSSSGCGCGK